MPLLQLPNELLSEVSGYLRSERDINAFAQTNRRLYRLLNTYLYRHNVRYFTGRQSALFWAATKGQRATAEKFLAEKPDAYPESLYLLALAEAAEKGHEEIVELLMLDKGIDIDAIVSYSMDGRRVTTLMQASIAGQETVVKLLLDRGANVDFFAPVSALEFACKNHQLHVARLLLDRGADVNARHAVQDDGTGETVETNALYEASSQGHEQIVKLLLERGANVNNREDKKIGMYGSALQAAVEEHHEPVVKVLLDYGADVNRGYQYAFHVSTPLSTASKNGRESMVKLLLDKGADVNMGGAWCGNALTVAADRNHLHIVKILLDHGADVNAQSDFFTEHDEMMRVGALYTASLRHLDVVKLLLEQEGVDVNLRGGHYNTALQAAAAEGRVKIVKLLLEHGADVNAEGGWYGTALRAAAAGGYERIVQLLLEKGADTEWKGSYGSALDAAMQHGHAKVVQMLRPYEQLGAKKPPS